MATSVHSVEVFSTECTARRPSHMSAPLDRQPNRGETVAPRTIRKRRKKRSALARLDSRTSGNGLYNPQAAAGTPLRYAGSLKRCLARPRIADPGRFL